MFPLSITNEKKKSFLGSLYWTLTTFIFGLLQIGIVLVWSLFYSKLNFSFQFIFENGIIIFFCIALIWSVALDFRLEMNFDLGKVKYDFFGTFVPGIIYVFSVVLYISTFVSNKETFYFLLVGELILLAFTLIYAIGLKYILILSK